MQQRVAGAFAVLVTVSQAVTFTQSGPPKAAIDITDEQVKAVNATPGVDRQLRIVDMGKYNLAVGIVHRGPTAGAARGAAAGRAAGAGGGAARGTAGAGAPAPVRCGEVRETPPADGVPGAIAHDATAETYVIVSGGGTLVTGGTIVNGTRSAPESDVTKILNGPSCSGIAAGNVVRRSVKPGDIIIIPAGVPHGWTDITDHVDYLSVRPDPDKVLQSGYAHPALSK